MDEPAKCELCGEPMPPGEEMFKYHGYSGPCPKPPLPQEQGKPFDAGGQQIIKPGGRIAYILPCGHDVSNRDVTLESGTVFCRLCDLQGRCRDAEGREKELHDELEMTADKLTDVWMLLDAYARGEPFTPEMAASLLRKQKAPGWKSMIV